MGLREKPVDALGVHRVGQNPDAEKVGTAVEARWEKQRHNLESSGQRGGDDVQEEAGLCSVVATRGFCFLKETGKRLHFKYGESGRRLE